MKFSAICNSILISIIFISFTNLTNAQHSVATSSATSTASTSISTSAELYASSTKLINTYIEVKDSCNHNYGGKTCVSVRLKPTTASKKVARLRNGIVLKTSELVQAGKYTWYKIDFDHEKINKRERLEESYYVRSDLVTRIENLAPEIYDELNPPQDTQKRIVIDLKKQTLEAFENLSTSSSVMKFKISSGNIDNKTEVGEYYVYYKTPSRYMQDSATSTNTAYFDAVSSSTKYIAASTIGRTDYKDYFDLPGVPYAMYFDSDGKAIHGAYWHNNFGRSHSHGCINLKLNDAKALYNWSPIGVAVLIK